MLIFLLFLVDAECIEGSKATIGWNSISFWIHRSACSWHCTYLVYCTSRRKRSQNLMFYCVGPLLLQIPAYYEAKEHFCDVHLIIFIRRCLLWQNATSAITESNRGGLEQLLFTFRWLLISIVCHVLFVRSQALTHLSGTRDPLPQSWKNFYLLIETTGSNESHDKYGNFLVTILQNMVLWLYVPLIGYWSFRCWISGLHIAEHVKISELKCTRILKTAILLTSSFQKKIRWQVMKVAYIPLFIGCSWYKVATCEHVDHIREKLDAFLESTMEKGLVADGVVAQGISQAASFWQLREVS